MAKDRLPIVRRTVFAAALAQALYRFCTIGLLGLGLPPLDFIFLWMVLPALILSALGEATPLGAGLVTGAFLLNVSLLALFSVASR